MNRRLVVVFVCALVAAACIGYLAYRALRTRPSASPGPPMADIVVARHTLGTGTLIGTADVRTAKWVGPVPKGAVISIDAVLNRGVITPIYDGEPVFVSRLAAAGSGAGLAALIVPGMRAFAVRVDDV